LRDLQEGEHIMDKSREKIWKNMKE
jgi:hypothetical protein